MENEELKEEIKKMEFIGPPSILLDPNYWKEKFGIDYIYQNGWYKGKIGLLLIDEKTNDLPYHGRNTEYEQEIRIKREQLEKENDTPFYYTIILRSSKSKAENIRQMTELKLEIERLHAAGLLTGLVLMNNAFLSMTSNAKDSMNLYRNYREFQYIDNGGELVSLPTMVVRSIWSKININQSVLDLYEIGQNRLKDFWKILTAFENSYGERLKEINQRQLQINKSEKPEEALELSHLNEEKRKILSNINELVLSQYVNKKVDMNASCQVILNYKEFEDFVNQNIVGKPEVAYDVETNGKPKMSTEHKIVGFSLASDGEKGCYVVFESLDYIMPKEDKDKIIAWMKENLFKKTFKKNVYNDKEEPPIKLWVYNAQHEVPVVYNHYGIFLRDIQDLFVVTKLLNCGRKLEKGGRGLKQQVMNLDYNDWSVDLDEFMKIFKTLRRPESDSTMRDLLLKYYNQEELPGVMEKLHSKYEELKESGELSEFISYGVVPYKLIGKYGSLDSSALFLLKASFDEKIDKMNELHKEERSGTGQFDLRQGYELWRKIHIAHIIMEMNGFYFNDKKVEKLNKWINTKSLEIMKYFVTSPLIDEWIRYKSFIHDFAFMLIDDHIDEIIDNDQEAKVMPIRNALTKDHIKFYKPTKRFIKEINMINEILYSYNLCVNANINTDNDEMVSNFLIQNGYEENMSKSLAQNIKLFYSKVYQTKPASYLNLEWTNKDGYIIKISWQQLIVITALSDFPFKEEQDKKYKEWLEAKLESCKTFEDYKELFNVNSTTRDFRNYISDILLSDYRVKLGHTYYKLYELYESPTFQTLLETLKNPIQTKSGKTWTPPQNLLIAEFLEEVEEIITEDTDGTEVFSYERLMRFEKLLNRDKFAKCKNKRPFYEDVWFTRGITRPIAECFEWIIDKEYKLTSLDSIMMEHLTLLYGMLGCNVDDRNTWKDNKAFEFMFNYKLIKKLLKAKTTYVFGATGRSVTYYIPKYYYKDGDLFPKRVMHYKENDDINDIYDKDLAIKIELEDGTIREIPFDKVVTLKDGTTKLAKDLTESDDVILEAKEQDLLEDDLESDPNMEVDEDFINDED